MHRLFPRVVVATALAAVIAGALLAVPASSGTKPSEVVVVNEAPLETTVTNDASNPVQIEASTPVQIEASTPLQIAASSPLAVTPPLWEGTPFLTSRVVLNSGPFEFCEVAFTAAEGTAVLLEGITGDFNVPPGGAGGMRVQLTLPDGAQRRVEVPMHPTAGALQVAGTYDRYAGSLVLDGFPVTGASVCLRGHDSAGSLEFIGFTVPLP